MVIPRRAIVDQELKRRIVIFGGHHHVASRFDRLERAAVDRGNGRSPTAVSQQCQCRRAPRLQEETSIRNLQDLAGKRIGVQQGGLSLATVPELQKYLQSQNRALVEIRQYRDFDAAYLDLIHSQIDAVLHNVVSLSVLVDEKLDLFEMGDRVGRRSYAAWAVRKGNADLLAFLNEFLVTVRRTGQMAQLQEKWLRIVFEDLPTQPLLPGDRPISA